VCVCVCIHKTFLVVTDRPLSVIINYSQATRRNIREDSSLQQHSRENLTSRILKGAYPSAIHFDKHI
jgi:hypothetical protein